MKWIIEKQHHGMIIRDYLQTIQRFSRRIIIAIKHDGGNIKVNGLTKTVRYELAQGDILEIDFPKEKVSQALKPEKLNLNIVYEDDAVMVLNKPARMAVMPSPNHLSGTMANGLLGYYQEQNRNDFTVHVVTRLDSDTSGLVLIAKDRYSHSLLSAQQQSGNVKRKYMAIVQGILENEAATIDAPIARAPHSIIEREVNEKGKQAITHYKKVKNLVDHTLVEVELETGRTHQIRVHFSHLGHPLAGDDLYGGSLQIIGRQALHCCLVSFEHPITKQNIQLQSNLPQDMEHMATRLNLN
ncbi:RluA family pseudouridine synthase [Oceanobacillus saliphilus]|uniref:RluA family pseudouridine synthase n=1 Tax=Oceanobacillus saliphilus TaxID=2925834 RepID=UPI00201DC63B|nr:RluA family pseudouridine synthase [Oceanobacillus saliphilus]